MSSAPRRATVSPPCVPISGTRLLAALAAMGLVVIGGAARAGTGLERLVGHWSCAGHFIANGASIAGELAIEADLRTGAVIVRHDDLAPGAYHALEVWTPDKSGPGFRAAISDRFSGMRWFEASGWSGDSLTWVRLEGGATAEQFEYVLTGPDDMRVDWSVARGGAMKLGDTLACRRAGP